MKKFRVGSAWCRSGLKKKGILLPIDKDCSDFSRLKNFVPLKKNLYVQYFGEKLFATSNVGWVVSSFTPRKKGLRCSHHIQ